MSMAIGLRSDKCTMTVYPTREERKRYNKIARVLKDVRDLEKFSLSDMTRLALNEFIERHGDELPAQVSHITKGHS